MTQNNTVICDNCNRDLTTTTNSVDYRLKLMHENIIPHSGPVTDVMFCRRFEGDKHFCNVYCLKEWMTDL